MKLPVITTLTLVLFVFGGLAAAQQKKSLPAKPRANFAIRSPEIGQTAAVINEKLSVLRQTPSLFSPSIQRMRRGRNVRILGVSEADGVKFYRVTAPPANFGWVQADAVFGKFRPEDEQRLAALVQATDGFEQIELAVEFFKLYPTSKLRSAILLLYGDIVEEAAVKLTKMASIKLKRPEMVASAAPIHSYYLNFVSLDRYRKLGIRFLFDSAKKQFHYDGASWMEIVKRNAGSAEAVEAKKRLESLKLKMGV